MIFTLLLLVVGILLFYAFVTTIKPRKFPPGPVWYPFIGSSLALQWMAKKYGNEWKACLEMSKQYSTNLLGFKISRELLVVVYGQKNVRQVFNDIEFNDRPHNFFTVLRCLGNKNKGITFANGEVWKEHRQFAVKNLKHIGYGKNRMEQVIQYELAQILKYLKEHQEEPIHLVDLLSESVINVIWKFVAGECINECKLRHLLDLLKKRGEAFSVAGGLLNQMPWCRFILPKWSGYTLLMEVNREISQIIQEAIDKHKNKEVDVEGNDFIYLFLEEMNANKNETYSEEQLKIVCLDFLIAGSQTTSNILGFALLKALMCEDIQQKIFQETEAIIGDNMPGWNDSDRFIYTSAFIQEVHRYYPTAPMAGPRKVQKDTFMDGCIIPKDTTILMSLGDIYRDPELWDDPEEFKPERFIDDNGTLKNTDRMYPFGLGRRRCPGEIFAKSFIFIILVGILQKYKMYVSKGTVPSDDPLIGILSTPRPYTAEFTLRK